MSDTKDDSYDDSDWQECLQAINDNFKMLASQIESVQAQTQGVQDQFNKFQSAIVQMHQDELHKSGVADVTGKYGSMFDSVKDVLPDLVPEVAGKDPMDVLYDHLQDVKQNGHPTFGAVNDDNEGDYVKALLNGVQAKRDRIAGVAPKAVEVAKVAVSPAEGEGAAAPEDDGMESILKQVDAFKKSRKSARL